MDRDVHGAVARAVSTLDRGCDDPAELLQDFLRDGILGVEGGHDDNDRGTPGGQRIPRCFDHEVIPLEPEFLHSETGPLDLPLAHVARAGRVQYLDIQ